MAVSESFLDAVTAIVGPAGRITEPDRMQPFLVEERGLFRGRSPMVVRPASTAEVAAVVRLCAAHRVPVVPQGGNTGLVGGGIPFESDTEIVLSLSRLNRIRAVDSLNFTATVEAGCVLADVQRAAEDAGRLFPLSLGAEGSCQIGGNVSTNAGGVAVLHYGNTRDLVLGLEVVLADGTVWDGLRALRKDNTGYDLKQLFIGAEGTLGIVTAAVVKLFPRPTDIQTALVALTDLDRVLPLLAGLRAVSGDALTAIELIPRIGLELGMRHVPGVGDPFGAAHAWYALVELSSSRPAGGLRNTLESVLAAAIAEGTASDAVLADSMERRQALWRIREAIPEAQKREGGSIKHDVSVPVSKVPAFIGAASAEVEAALPGVRVVAFGHVGDGNIHFNLTQPAGADRAAFLAHWERCNRVVHDRAAALGGSISAEHGIGRLKKRELVNYKAEVELALMRRIKSALDPLNIMNPGKIL